MPKKPRSARRKKGGDTLGGGGGDDGGVDVGDVDVVSRGVAVMLQSND